MTPSRYRVLAGYVTVETRTAGGRAHVDRPHGSVLPEDVPAEQLEQLLARGDIVEVLDDPDDKQVESEKPAAPAKRPARGKKP